MAGTADTTTATAASSPSWLSVERLPLDVLSLIFHCLPVFEGEWELSEEVDHLSGNRCPSLLVLGRTCRALRAVLRSCRAVWRTSATRVLLSDPTTFVFKASDFRLVATDASSSQQQQNEHLRLTLTAWRTEQAVARRLLPHRVYQQFEGWVEESTVGSSTSSHAPPSEDELVYLDFGYNDMMEADGHKLLDGEFNLSYLLVLPSYCGFLHSLHLTVDGGMCPMVLSTRERCDALFCLSRAPPAAAEHAAGRLQRGQPAPSNTRAAGADESS